MLKPYFKNGVLTEDFDTITPGFIEALTIGFVRYMGDSRTSASGLERPLSVLFSVKNSENAKKVFDFFKSAFDFVGLDFENAGEMPKNEFKKSFFDRGFDAGIIIRSKSSANSEKITIEIFERGDDIGGLEASLPGGVNFEGKVKSVNHALPIPQIAVNHIEHALNTEIGFSR